MKYPSHGYRWLNAEIKLDTGLNISDPYAHKCCKIAGIKSKSKHYRYKKPGEPRKVYPNLILAGLKIDGPMRCIVSDMTAFRLKGVYYELTLYMDLWNNEILSHSLSAKRGDRMTYISVLNDLIELKKQYPEYKMVLHSDQGRYMHPKTIMTCLDHTASYIPCHVPERRQTMQRWKPLVLCQEKVQIKSERFYSFLLFHSIFVYPPSCFS